MIDKNLKSGANTPYVVLAKKEDKAALGALVLCGTRLGYSRMAGGWEFHYQFCDVSMGIYAGRG